MRMLRIIAAMLALAALVAGTQVAHAAIGACGSDPVVTFQGGQQLSLQAYADTTELSHVTHIYFAVNGKAANAPTSYSSPGSNESMTLQSTLSSSFQYDYEVTLRVATDDGSSATAEIGVTYNGTTTYTSGALNSFIFAYGHL